MRILAWLVGLGVGIAFVLQDPAHTLEPNAIWPVLRATVATLLWVGAAIGAGGALVHRVSPTALKGPIGWAHGLVVGILVWGLGGLLLGSMGLIGPMGFGGLFLLMASGWFALPSFPKPVLTRTVWLVGAVLLFPGLIGALAPATATDAIYYHLAIPAQMLIDGELVGGLLHPQGSRPLLLHLPYAALLATGGPLAPALFHWFLSACVLMAVFQIGREHLDSTTAGAAAALLLGGSWTFLHETGQLGNDIPTSLAVLCALDAALRSEARVLALAAGTALSLKYTAAGPVAGVFLVAALPWTQRIRMGLVAIALVLPWWARNAVEGLHPLFPFAGWPDVGFSMVFLHLDKYGSGRGALDLLLLPWNAIMNAELTSFRFLGRLTPAFLFLGPLAIWAARAPGTARRLTLAAAAVGLTWALGPHWLRYLLPGLPILALAAASGIPRAVASKSIAGSALLAGLLGLPANWMPLIEDTADRMKVVTGQESQEAYLGRHLTGYGAIQWANAHLPDDARVAMLFSWTRAHLLRAQILGSVEDHVPTRHWVLAHGTDSLHALRRSGATHAIVRRTKFIADGYPFLSRQAFTQAFRAPVRTLEDALLMQANLLYSDAHLRVYRLPDTDR